MDHWRLGHRPALDGLRGIAILLVVAAHANFFLEPLGHVGVTMFFTLSGFLITALLLGERDRSGQVSFRGFYRNRVLRLIPAFLVMFAVVTTISLAVYGKAPYWWSVLAEVGNWTAAAHGANGLFLLNHTWSLAIEEQFYLIWPIVLTLVASRHGRRGVIALASSGILGSVVLANVLDGARVEYGTDTNASSLLIGCLLAALMVGRQPVDAPVWALPFGGALILLGMNPPDLVLPIVPLGTALVIWVIGTRGSAALAWRPLTFAGQISYGWYLWNFPITLLVRDTDASRIWAAPLSLAVALISWRYVEQPFLRMKARRSRGVVVRVGASV